MDEYMKTTMKVCMNVECAGKEQPHSYDASAKGLDCDGPCSERRVAAWNASRTAETTEPTPSIKGTYDMCGRDVLLVPLRPDESMNPATVDCFDCGDVALTVVIDGPTEHQFCWAWCGVCQIG